MDAEPAGALLAGGTVGELEREGGHARRCDADIEAGAFSVVEYSALIDSPFWHRLSVRMTLLFRPRLVSMAVVVVSVMVQPRRLLWGMWTITATVTRTK
jgi:hypothetical protein